MSAPIRMIWPVYGFVIGGYSFQRETVAEFFDWSDARDLVSSDHSRNLFIAPPRYDRREAGYRAQLR